MMEMPIRVHPTEHEFVGKGHTANIYLMGNEAVKADDEDLELIENDYMIQRTLHGAGYPVPEPYRLGDVAAVDLEYCPTGISMERIWGVDLEDMLEKDEDKAKALMKKAEKIVEDIGENLGIGIQDLYSLFPRNVMYDERNNRVVLIDFGFWEII